MESRKTQKNYKIFYTSIRNLVKLKKLYDFLYFHTESRKLKKTIRFSILPYGILKTQKNYKIFYTSIQNLENSKKLYDFLYFHTESRKIQKNYKIFYTSIRNLENSKKL